MKKKINKKNIISFIQGNIRYKLFYSKKWSFLIPLYIREQIEIRILSMNPECYSNGSCKECGCMTTHLQMANTACDGNCYPSMLSKDKWKYIKEGNLMYIDDCIWKLNNSKFIRLIK